MSRIIVKNIPTKIDETKLRELFEECGQVTDVKLQKCRNGRSRHFGFVGYRSEHEAEAAVKHFNKTFLNSVRIEVEIAKRYGDSSIPRPWSRYAKGSSAYAKLQKEQSQIDEGSDSTEVNTNKSLKDQQLKYETQKSKLTKLLADYYDLEKDPTFKEFVSLHSKKDKSKTWSNEHAEQTDEITNVKPKVTPHIESVEAKRPGGKGILLARTHLTFESDSESEDPSQSAESKSRLSDVEYLRSKVVKSKEIGDHVNTMEDHVSSSESCDDEELQESHPRLTLKMRGLPFSATEQDVKDFFHPVSTKEIRLVQTAKGRPSGRAFVDFYNQGDLKQSLTHHKEYMNNRYVELFIDEGPTARKLGGANEEVGSKRQQPLKHYKLGNTNEDESLLDSGRLFVRNLPYSVTEEDITKLFEKYGPLTEVMIPLDKEGSHSIGYAFITFVFPEHAVKALEELDGSIFQGRLLHLMPSKDKDLGNINDEKLDESSSYKKKKAAKQKGQAGSSHNWNTLFLGQNAVVDAMASQFKTTKSAILDPESHHSSAVNVALGETQLVEETRQFLESNGVDLSCFEPGKKLSRSKTVILAKNLPFGTTAEEFIQLFSTFGGLDHVILPPAGVTAIIKFFEPHNAKSAFRALAYTKFKQLPLYLEWAPDGVVKSKPTIEDSTAKEDENTEVDSSIEGTTVFVKNLNFTTEDENLKAFFSKCGRVLTARVARKHNTKDPSNPLSMGFGFVEFKMYDDATNAIKRLQHKLLDGHQLELKLSHKKMAKNSDDSEQHSDVKDSQKLQETSKLLVRNVPFEATSKELKEVFGTFGELKTLRLPKKIGKKSGHRGFAFVEYATRHDAKRAFESLHYSTHLYGRRLVLEWAGHDDTVADIRRKTTQHLQLPESVVKRRKLMEQLLNSTESVDEE